MLDEQGYWRWARAWARLWRDIGQRYADRHTVKCCTSCDHIAAYHTAFGCTRGVCQCRVPESFIQSVRPMP